MVVTDMPTDLWTDKMNYRNSSTLEKKTRFTRRRKNKESTYSYTFAVSFGIIRALDY